MKDAFTHRLNEIVPRLLSKELLENTGLGAEIGFYIFDYPPEHEITVNNHLEFVKKEISKKKPDLIVQHINLFQFLVDYLRKNKLLDSAIDMQRKKGDAALMKALKGPLNPEKLAKEFAREVSESSPDLVLISGVGPAYPIIRSHSLLNNLHALMDKIPVILFFPGVYDGQGLKLFSKLGETNYYRAFKLVP